MSSDMKGIMFIDLETENHEYYGAVSSPRHPDNYVVMVGWAVDYQPYQGEVQYKHFLSKEEAVDWLKIPDDVWLIVAHNFSFELDWMYSQCYPELRDFINRGGMIWCTQLAEYRLSRQQHLYPNLNDTAVRHGGNTKLDLVALEWQQGKLTSEICPEMLRDYLVGTEDQEGDIGNTRIAFYGQYVEAQNRGMFNAILAQSQALLYTAICSSNGLYVDQEVAHQNKQRLEDRLDELLDVVKEELPEELREVFNIGSIYHKSALVYGGAIRFQTPKPRVNKKGEPVWKKKSVVFREGSKEEYIEVEGVPDLELELYLKENHPEFKPTRYIRGKNQGKIKVERVDSDVRATTMTPVIVDLPGVVDTESLSKEFKETFLSEYTSEKITDPRGNPIISTGEDALLDMLDRPELSETAKQLITALWEHAIHNKALGSFYDKITYNKNGSVRNRSGMFQYITDQNLVHHSLGTCATTTGRLNSSRPNLQQIPADRRPGVMPSNVKQMFTSRFGEQGYLLEIDYNALEVRAMADFTKDKNLQEAILKDTDMHVMRASSFHGIPYEEFYEIYKDPDHPEQAKYDLWREDIKAPSFAYQYGASEYGISYATGWTVEDAKKFIENEQELFPEVEEFFARIAGEIQESQEYREFTDLDGRKFVEIIGHLKAPSGFEYEYKAYPTKKWVNGQSYTVREFKPTQMRNYIIQGDSSLFVQIATSYLIRHLFKEDFYDMKCLPINTVHDQVLLDVHEEVLEEVIPRICSILEGVPHYMESLGYKLDMPYPVEASIGRTWLDQEVYKFDKE